MRRYLAELEEIERRGKDGNGISYGWRRKKIEDKYRRQPHPGLRETKASKSILSIKGPLEVDTNVCDQQPGRTSGGVNKHRG